MLHCCGWAGRAHCTAPGVHTGGKGQEHVPHAHVCEQVWLPYLLQTCVVDGEQTPWLLHDPWTHMPVSPHVSVSVPQLPQGTGFVSLGPHTPVQTPVTQV
jgi:hypothetical protein